MKRVLIIAAAFWIMSYGATLYLGTPLPVAWASAILILAGAALLPFGAARWAHRELQPKARWTWLGLNLIVIAALGTRFLMLAFALVAANISIWAAFAASRWISLRRLHEPANGS